MLQHAINRIYRVWISVFFDDSISWGWGLSSASLREGECYTEFLLFCSKVKSEKRILLSHLCWASSARGEAGLISTPQDPFEKVIAPGLFDFLSEAIAVFLTVTLLLRKTEDINEYYCDGKSRWKSIDDTLKCHPRLRWISYFEILKITFLCKGCFNGYVCLKERTLWFYIQLELINTQIFTLYPIFWVMCIFL